MCSAHERRILRTVSLPFETLSNLVGGLRQGILSEAETLGIKHDLQDPRVISDGEQIFVVVASINERFLAAATSAAIGSAFSTVHADEPKTGSDGGLTVTADVAVRALLLPMAPQALPPKPLFTERITLRAGEAKLDVRRVEKKKDATATGASPWSCLRESLLDCGMVCAADPTLACMTLCLGICAVKCAFK